LELLLFIIYSILDICIYWCKGVITSIIVRF